MRPGLRYVGVEPSEYAVRRFGARRGLVQGSVESLTPLGLHRQRPEGFDLVICCGVLNYVPARLLPHALEELALHTGGVAWLELFTSRDDIQGDIATMRRRSPEWYASQLAAAGLTACGLHLYLPADRALSMASLEVPQVPDR
jgi:hypothetical protein